MYFVSVFISANVQQNRLTAAYNAVYYSFEENDGQSKHRGLLGQDIYYSAIKFGGKTYSGIDIFYNHYYIDISIL